MLWKRKLGMWWRLNREESNFLMKQCKREQIDQSLPWILELNEIACHLKVDLTKAKEMSKDAWKQDIKEKIKEKTKHLLETEIEELKRYKKNVKDEIEPGKKKRYTKLTQKKAKIWFRMRADIIDPTPRQPYNPTSIWKCKFCDEKDQSTEHYVKSCTAIKEEVFDGMNRELIYNTIQTLEGNDARFSHVTQILIKLYNLIIK